MRDLLYVYLGMELVLGAAAALVLAIALHM
jgi:hypothetical protein